MATDTLLLADVFENFRKVCQEKYGLDPAHYYTTPGLSWDALLKKTGVELELLTDLDIFFFFFFFLFFIFTILITYATYNTDTYTIYITYNTIRLLTLLTILILTLTKLILTVITIFTIYSDYLPDLQFLHNEIELTYNTFKKKKKKKNY